ncbi:MAG TPA: hypothetical protein VFQ65_25740 [Kofleriaceae bacterium]|nr:hypothetical protein [Kofleriaceae bacterium]
MTMLRLVDGQDDAPPRMTMFRTLAARVDGVDHAHGGVPVHERGHDHGGDHEHDHEQVAARGSSSDLRAALGEESDR